MRRGIKLLFIRNDFQEKGGGALFPDDLIRARSGMKPDLPSADHQKGNIPIQNLYDMLFLSHV